MDNENCTIVVKFGSNCTVGIWRNNKVEIILNENESVIPSIISFTKKDILIGKTAKFLMNSNPKNTIYGINQLIGERFDDPKIQKFIKNVPFKVEKDSNSNKPIIIIEKENKTLNFLPEELYSIILEKLKENAEKYLKINIKNIIITVPANFSLNQRESIKKAVELAKLNLIEIMNEPIFACIAYGLEKLNKENHILVFHMGSSKLNVSILNVKDNSFRIRTSIYDENLGGDSYDNEFVKYCIKKLKEKINVDINKFPKERRYKILIKLKEKCERQRILLSTSENIPFEFNNFIEGKNLYFSIERKNFENICKNLFDGCIKLVEKALETTGLKKNEIDKIIMSGGCTLMPKIRKIMKNYFKGKEFYQTINPKEIYTYGATIQSHFKYKIKDNILETLKYLNDIEKSRDFVDKLEVSKVFEKMKLFTNNEITKNVLEVVQLNNPEKEEQRKEEIKNLVSQLNNNELTNKEYTENVLNLGSNIKEDIIYNVYHNPDKFVSISEIENSEEGSSLFIQGALSTYLNNNDILCVIEKETENENVAHTLLQLITSGEAFRKVIKISYTYGDFEDALILSNEDEKDNFIKMKKKEYSKAFNISEQDIIIADISKGTFTIKFIDQDATNDQITQIKKEPSIKDAKLCCLLTGCKISPSIFDSRGDRKEGWGINQKRGPPGYLIEYDPPIGWDGYGLRVKGEYDDGDDTWLGFSNIKGEWYIAYHGTSLRYANDIIEEGFKAGQGQVHENDKNMNPLNNDEIPICGRGVYVTPKIKVADEYSGGYSGWSWSENLFEFKGVKYQLVFMCRVNPYKIRICEDEKDYWIVSGDKIGKESKKEKYDNEIRPYRILLKEFKENN